MLACSVLYPFEIEHAAGEILRGMRFDVEIAVGDKVSEGTPGAAAAAQRFGLNRRMIVGVSAGFEKAAHAVRQPQGGKYVRHGLVQLRREVALGDEHGNILRQAVRTPDIENVFGEAGLAVKIRPGNPAGIVRIMLEGQKSEIRTAPTDAQIIEKSSEP